MSKLCVIDFDTCIISAAAQNQQNRCLATHRASGRQKLFMSKTEFNQWLGVNDRWHKDEFEFEASPILVGEPHFAFHSIKQKLENIVEASGCDDYILCIEGEGNFRKEYKSEYVHYKGHRTSKPLLFEECVDFVKRKYKDRIVEAVGDESDDRVSILGWDAYRTKKDVVIAYIDKDIKANVPGNLLNYGKPDDGIKFNSEFDVAYNFAVQMLIGDTADNIDGIIKLADVTKSKYSIKTKGVGVKSAEKILASCSTKRELAQAVMECYQLAWGEEGMRRLHDMGFFLYMKREENDWWSVARWSDGQ